MKKILALILILCCCFAVVSCRGGDDGENKASASDLERFSEMFASSAPTKSVVTSTIEANSQEITSVYTLTTGIIAGKAASIFESRLNKLAGIDEDKGDLNVTEESVVKYNYLEGKGVRIDKNGSKGKWDTEGVDFAPVEGELSLDLKKKYFETMEYYKDGSNETLVLTIAEDLDGENGYVKKVFGKYIPQSQEFGYETKITITAAGGRISNILVESIDYEHFIGDDYDATSISDVNITIDVTYSYDIQTDMTID